MEVVGSFWIILVLTIVVSRLKRGLAAGLCWVASFMIALPTELALSLPGNLPELTLHRMLLLIVAALWVKERAAGKIDVRVPFKKEMAFLGLAHFVSLLCSTTFNVSFKSYLALLWEVLLFFGIASTTLRKQEDLLRTVKGVAMSLSIVAGAAVVERYTGRNWAREILLGEPPGWHDITAVYRHRIMFGYAMAAGFPLCLLLACHSGKKLERLLWWSATLLVIVGCYFSFSRGPWIGILLASLVLAVLGRRPAHKALIVLSLICATVWFSQPGIAQTIVTKARSLSETDTGKGRSAQYRLLLWKVAFEEVGKGPQRFLFGYGGDAIIFGDYSDYFDRHAGGGTAKLGFTSWDNNYAANLVQFGTLGLATEIMFYLAMIIGAAKAWFVVRETDPWQDVSAAMAASAAVYLFALSNVSIFNPQLTWLFLGTVAVGINIRFVRAVPGSALAAV